MPLCGWSGELIEQGVVVNVYTGFSFQVIGAKLSNSLLAPLPQLKFAILRVC